MITIIGVGHVFDIGEAVRDAILEREPHIVCLELDRRRFEALFKGEGRGDAPFEYKILAYFQRRIAGKYGAKVGDEMVSAIRTAKESKASIAFIDYDSTWIFARIWQKMSFKERVKLLVSGLSGLFISRKRIDRELRKFEKDSDTYINAFGKELPTVKKVLIDERNVHMAKAIREINTRYPNRNIVAVVGDGHVDGIHRLLKDLNPEIIRLGALVRGEYHIQKKNAEVMMTFTVGERGS